MRKLTNEEQAVVNRFAMKSGVDSASVDPFEKDYVWGLEHLHYGNRPDHYDALSPEEKSEIHKWIERTLEPAKSTRSCPCSSYGLKHWFGNETTDEHSWWHNPHGFYISNGQFKGAMLAAGYTPDDADALNPYYRVKLTQAAREEVRKYRKHWKSREQFEQEAAELERLFVG